MSREVPTIEGQASVVEAAKTVIKFTIGLLIVLKDGKPVGVITERDFVERVVAREANPKKLTASEIMSSPLITIDPDEDIIRASELMQRYHIRRLPVVKDGVIQGVITSRDIAQHCGDYIDKATREVMRWAWGAIP
jgi:CBS domain-containing protein